MHNADALSICFQSVTLHVDFLRYSLRHCSPSTFSKVSDLLLDLLDMSVLLIGGCNTLLGGNMRQSTWIVVLLYDQLMGITIDMQIFREDHNVLGLAKDLGNLLQRNSTGFRQDEVEKDPSNERDADEEEIEVPANGGERGSRGLQIDQIRQCDRGDGKTDALGANVVGEDLAIPDHTAHVDSEAVDSQESVEGDNTECKTDPVLAGGWSCSKGCNHGGFNDHFTRIST